MHEVCRHAYRNSRWNGIVTVLDGDIGRDARETVHDTVA
jgi:hypothetical protein